MRLILIPAHTLLGYQLYPDEDYTIPDNDPQDRHGHGSHVAGISAVATNNSIGIAGVAWNCKIMPIRAGFKIYHPSYGMLGILETDDWARAIDWARNTGTVKVLNMSFGGYSPTNESEVAAAYNAGIALIAASGNNNTTNEHYPAAYNNYVIAVGATDEGDYRCDPGDWGIGYGSNYGSWLDVVAPGNSIRSTDYNNTYSYRSGTSMAAPHVAGLAALILSKTSSFTPINIRKRLEHTAEQVGGYTYSSTTGKSNELGHGRINAVDALKYYFVPSTEYTTIKSALEDAVSGYTVTVATGTYIENDNLTVNSGVTLQLNPGVTVKMASGKKLTINGTLSAQGTSSNKITFDKSGGSSWYGIKFEYSSVDGNCILEHCIIKNASYGIYCNQATPITIRYCDIRDVGYGIFCYYSPNTGYFEKIQSNSVHETSTRGILFSHSYYNIFGNDIYSNSSIGVHFDDSNPDTYNNDIYQNGDRAFISAAQVPKCMIMISTVTPALEFTATDIRVPV